MATNWSERFNKGRATLERTAVHEAGHAVVAMVMGCPPSDMIAFVHKDGVTVDGAVTRINPTVPQPTGKVPLTPAQQSYYSRFAVCKPAGLAAEEKLVGREVTVDEAGAVQDMAQLVGMVQLVMGHKNADTGVPACKRVASFAERILANPDAWELVGKVATALVNAPVWKPSPEACLLNCDGDFTTYMKFATAQVMRRIDPETMKRLVAESQPVIEKVRKRLDIDAHGEYVP